ncbi:MAG: N,N-dimethylformamidase [Proteobacteria bacterium]|nr:MAG: N,N-dimethylformamidase [Pseudomonadota bacterium]
MSEKTVVGYADRFSVAPGESVRFFVSTYAPGPYRADLVRVVRGGEIAGGPEVNAALGLGVELEPLDAPFAGAYPGRTQRVAIGSCATIPASPAFAQLASFAIEALVWPTRPLRGDAQAIASTWCEATQSGVALHLDAAGALALRFGDGSGRVERFATGVPLLERRWAYVAARFDAAAGALELVSEPLPVDAIADLVARAGRAKRRVAPAGLAFGEGPLLFAAWRAEPGEKLVTAAHFDGRIEAPRLFRRAVAIGLAASHARGPRDPELVAAWDFARDLESEAIRDAGPQRLDGATVNLPTRAVPGARWDGSEHDWRRAPAHYGAIHFHADDLADAGWESDFAFTVPADLPSGIYAARLRHGASQDEIPFCVRPPRGAATAPLAFLVPSASYLSYANVSLHLRPGSIFGDPPPVPIANDRFFLAHPECGLSQYDSHADGSGVVVSSLHRPILNLKAAANPWGFAADTLISAWLRASGQPFDVLTDEDLHREGAALLASYRAVVTGSHPEYWSTAMLDALASYLEQGGRWMYLGGNGFYWRIAFHPTRHGVIEVRRAEDGTRAWIAEPGEYHHMWGGEYGGLWRRLGRPPNRLVGVGFAAQGVDAGRFRRTAASRDPRAAFLFEGVAGETIESGSFVGSASFEIDRFDPALGSPLHALVVARSENHAPAMLRTKEEFHETKAWAPDPAVRADMVFFETPRGGAVFSTGSISWSLGLLGNGGDNDVARVTGNALRRFLDPRPFEAPPPR